jgi:pimeloyl-ACP methyl ester carboxylesterase
VVKSVNGVRSSFVVEKSLVMTPAVPRRVRRAVRVSAVLVASLALLGTTYQGVATSLERHRFLRPGGLVDGGGYHLHIYCLGKGSPTVILEAGAGAISSAWGLVQPRIAWNTRVCSYDRSGLGWSEGDGRYVPARVVDSLRTLLREANEPGPFVVVGQELGSAFARLFAVRDSTRVVALVLIDDPLGSQTAPSRGQMVAAWPWLARVGILRAIGGLSTRANQMPGESGGAIRAFLNRPDHLTQAAREISRASEVVAAAQAVRLDPSVQVASVTTGNSEQPAMIVTPEEAAAVVGAIEETVSRVRANRSGARDEP